MKNTNAINAIKEQHNKVGHAINHALNADYSGFSKEAKEFVEEASWLYVDMCRLFEMMDQSDDEAPDPFCFELYPDDAIAKLKESNPYISNEYHGIETHDCVYNLQWTDGRYSWKAADPDKRVIPEDGEKWCDVFYESHIKPKLMKFLAGCGLVA